MIGLSDAHVKPGVVQAVGEGIAMLKESLGIAAVDKNLDGAAGNTISSEKVLAVTDVEKAFGLA